MVKYLTTMQHYQDMLEESKTKLVVIDFTATWCPPCRMIGPIFEAISNEGHNAAFYKVDVDEASDIASECGISAMPTFIFFKDGVEVKKFSGASEQLLRETLTSLL